MADLVFPGRPFPPLRTFKRDRVAAGLETETGVAGTASGQERYDLADSSGRALDFHRLRVTFVSNFVAAGVHSRVAQAPARHAKVETTMAVYADLTVLDVRGGGGAGGGKCGCAVGARPHLRWDDAIDRVTFGSQHFGLNSTAGAVRCL